MKIRSLLAAYAAAAVVWNLASAVEADLLTGMTAYWRFNESSGLIAGDSIGANNAALLGNAALANDAQRGQVLSLDGSIGTDALTPGNPVTLGAGTILGWIKLDPSAATGTRQVFPGQGISGGNRIYIQSVNGDLKIGMGSSSSIGSTGVHLDSNWHQIALAWSGNGGSGGFSAYYDGVQVQASTFSGLSTPANWFSMGSNFDPNDIPPQSSNWIGRIDEVGVWNRRLTTQEVQSIYSAGQITPAGGLTPPPAQQIVRTYSFDSLKPGNIAGQDYWTAPTFGNLAIKNGAGVNTTVVAGEGDSNGLVTRINNAASAFVKFQGNETAAISQFDLTLTSGHGTGGGQIFGLGHDRNGNFAIDQDNEYGPMFGIRDGYNAVYQRQFGFYLKGAGNVDAVGSPIGNLGTMGDWVQVRLVSNFLTGKGSLYFRNLTRGEANFIAVPGLQNIDLNLSAGPTPATWDAMILRNDHQGQFDNLIPNYAAVLAVPEPGSAVPAIMGGCVIGVWFGRQRWRRSKRPAPAWFRQVAFAVCALVGTGAAVAHGQTLSKGQRIIQQRGLQIQALVDPQAPWADVPPFNLNQLKGANFTSVMIDQFDRTWPLDRYLGPAPGIPSSLLLTYGYLNSIEEQFLPNLVAIQLGDEQDITLQVELDAAKNLLADWRAKYPNTIGYLNQAGTAFSAAALQNYVSYVKPDMVMWDQYSFNGNVNGGSPTSFYRDAQKYRQLGLGGHDGTGQHPIPYGMYLQTSIADYLNNHITSASEIRLNEFAAWAFGYTYVTAYMYYNPSTTLFTSAPSDATPRQPQFNDITEANRQSLNLGSALVRLQSTDVAMVMGQYKVGSSNVTNPLPSGVPAWSSGRASDPYLTGVSATNIGTVNSGLKGDVVIGHFKPMQGATDQYFMIVNGLTDATGNLADTTQRVRLAFNFGTSGINSLLRLSRLTGQVETVSLVHDLGSNYHLDLILEGGTGDLFKYNNGTGFVMPLAGDFDSDGDVDGADLAAWQTHFPLPSGATLATGDADGDGDVDGADFVVWQTHYASSPGSVVVPEPTALALAAIAISMLAGRAAFIF